MYRSYSSGRFSSKYNHPVPTGKFYGLKVVARMIFPIFLPKNEILHSSLYPVT